MKVMMLVKMKVADTTRPPTKEAILAMHAYNEELQKAGVLLDLGGLTPEGVVLKYRGTKCTVIDGPFAEAKEMIAGYSLLEVKNLAEAVEWAKRAPHDLQDGDEVELEIRPLFDPSTFDPGQGV